MKQKRKTNKVKFSASLDKVGGIKFGKGKYTWQAGGSKPLYTAVTTPACLTEYMWRVLQHIAMVHNISNTSHITRNQKTTNPGMFSIDKT